jgi:hypothetical protein
MRSFSFEITSVAINIDMKWPLEVNLNGGKECNRPDKKAIDDFTKIIKIMS